MDLTTTINTFIVFIIWAIMILLALLLWWLFVFVMYAPSFRNRKLKKLIREDMMEYNEILADKSRLNIEKANTQLQYDQLVIKKAEKQEEIKQALKELENTQRTIAANKDVIDTLSEFMKTPQGQLFIQTQAQKQIIKENSKDAAKSDDVKSKESKKQTKDTKNVEKD